MSKKLEDLIKALKEAKDILNKDDVDEKIKAKLMAEMKRRNFGEADATRHVIDRDRGEKLPKPPKQPKPLLQSEMVQETKLAAARALKKKEEPEETKKSASDLADDLIKSLEKATGEQPLPKRSVQGHSGWSQDPATGAFHHGKHGVISTFKQPNGKLAVIHNGKRLGEHADAAAAGAKIKEHMDHLASFRKSEDIVPSKNGLKKTAAEVAEERVMGMLAKTVGQMMPKNAQLQPTQEQFEQAMIDQGIAYSQEQLEKMDNDWGNTMTDFFREANKPISQRFKSPEEEEAYWANIKVTGGTDNGPGY